MWRFLTPLFVHMGVAHLFIVVIIELVIGFMLEKVVGSLMIEICMGFSEPLLEITGIELRTTKNRSAFTALRLLNTMVASRFISLIIK